MYEVSVRAEFAAAHFLRNYKGSAEPLHGHNFRVEVVFVGEETGPGGMLVDFLEVQQHLQAVVGEFEHSCLNDQSDFRELEPSAEHLARVIFERLDQRWTSKVARLDRVTAWETDAFAATFRPPCKTPEEQ